MTMSPSPSSLPCFPCPHRGICCQHGADISEAEAAALIAKHGEHVVARDDEGPRTAVKSGICVFHKPGGECSIHADPEYPAVCRAYPWTDGLLGGPYQGDRQECPEFHPKETP